MNSSKILSLGLAGFLQLAPLALRVAPPAFLAARSPVAIVLNWVIATLAVAGSYHTVSAATAVLVSATRIDGKVGTRLSYQIKIDDGSVRRPESWSINGTLFSSSGSTTAGLPPGLSLSLTTGIISGIPTKAGTYALTITAAEHNNLSGAKLTFTLTFVIAANGTAPRISVQPVGRAVHPGETATLSVTATGDAPLSYQWKRDGAAIPGGTSASLAIPQTTAADAGIYSVVVSNAIGSIPSDTAEVAVVTMSMSIALAGSPGIALSMTTIPGRSYVVESTDGLPAGAWEEVTQVTSPSEAASITDSRTPPPLRCYRYRTAP